MEIVWMYIKKLYENVWKFDCMENICPSFQPDKREFYFRKVKFSKPLFQWFDE